MAFHQVRLPTEIEIGARGGLGFMTVINDLNSGGEQRNIDWAQARGSWDISYGSREKSVIDAVKAHHLARYGKAHTFPFKDWSDYVLPRQGIGTGDGATSSYPIYKLYGGDGGYYYQRYLALVVDGSAAAWIDGVQQGTSEFTITTTTLDGFLVAHVTFPTNVPGGHVVEFACQFDCLVRYDVDRLEIQAITVEDKDVDDVTAQDEGLEQLGPTPIIEVRRY
jgi:uncharacterized protein (TIGR02217 family)